MPEQPEVHEFDPEVQARLVPCPVRQNTWIDPVTDEVWSMPAGWKPAEAEAKAEPKGK